MTVQDALEAFVKNRNNYADFNKKMVENLILGDKSYSLITNMYEVENIVDIEKLDNDAYEYAVKESVRKYTKDKDNAISVYSNLTNFLNRKYKTDFNLDTPPISVSDRYQRLIYIMKRLQDSNVNVETLMDELWMGRDTIEDDIKAIRGKSHKSIEFGTGRLSIDGTNLHKGSVTFKSTAHPLVMVSNLSEVLVMLKGLHQVSSDVRYEATALSAASDIWRQLSPYAKSRIRTVVGEMMHEDISWYSLLDNPEINREKNIFVTEEEIARNTNNSIFLCMKAGIPCTLIYATEHGPVTIENVIVTESFKEDDVKYIRLDNKELIEMDKIVSCFYE